MNIIITGRPGIGKTTLIRKLIEKTAHPKGGFYTEEILRDGKRTGFRLKTLQGRESILASTDIRSRYRVGKYRVDVDTFERVGVASVENAIAKGELIVIDEIGKMELFSRTFRNAVRNALDTKRVIATMKIAGDVFTGKIKRRLDVKIFELTIENRKELLGSIIGTLSS